ncbi:MAG: phage tail protein [Alphaproteobacteria bacterium]|nr:MAG: phage tail protein [Alphaproteobacteria bacterium]
MSSPYVGQILIFAGNFAPAGWMTCQGQSLPISEYETLFNLIGTTYGGDGQATFNLPDLRGRAPVHMGQGSGLSSYAIGQNGGVEAVTITTQQMPSHNHLVQVITGNTASNTSTPSGSTILSDETQSGAATASFVYVANSGANQNTLATQTIANSGGNQPHENRQPLLVLNYIISLFGVYPSPN